MAGPGGPVARKPAQEHDPVRRAPRSADAPKPADPNAPSVAVNGTRYKVGPYQQPQRYTTNWTIGQPGAPASVSEGHAGR